MPVMLILGPKVYQTAGTRDLLVVSPASWMDMLKNHLFYHLVFKIISKVDRITKCDGPNQGRVAASP